MLRNSADIQDLEKEAYRIVAMICSETVPSTDLDRAIDDLRSSTREVFPGRESLFDETYGRRFQRLRSRFRPRNTLLDRPR